MARSTPPSGQPNGNPPQSPGTESHNRDVELLRVLVSRKGTQVDAQWAIHPQLKQDLLPQEWEEVTDLMAKVTAIVGTKFSQVLAQADPEPPSNA
ncbi:MAG: hypothetical protein JW394_0417 [Nitrospira sp.]|nr:hypothetical protein [Nitrospira sp.]